MQERIIQLLNDYHSISLKEIECVKLMTRTDQKYVCSIRELPGLLHQAKNDFHVLENLGTRLPGYETLYLDTPEYRMYLDHHNGNMSRNKIRIREYLTSKELFLEIKIRDNRLNTEKKRIPIAADRNFLMPQYIDFIKTNTPFDPEKLRPVLTSSFSRITLVRNEVFERVTIDIHPEWRCDDRTIRLDNLVIIEVKSAKTSNSCGFGQLLREERIFPKRLSKYCIGLALLNPGIKQNRFKEKLLYLQKLDKKIIYDESFLASV